MNKKLMALAVASALGTPAVALAQGASTVQIYGTAYLEYSLVDQGRSPLNNGTPAAPVFPDYNDVDMFQTPGSNIGFKGEEALGGGMSAWFQCESTAAIVGSGVAGFCSRNSAIGFKGGWGNLFAGQWDTPFKRTQGVTRGILNETGIYGTSFLTAGGSSTYIANASPAVFIRRQAQMWNYDTPNWGGFQAMFAVSSNQSSTGQSSGASNGKARLWSVGLQYINGPLAVTGAYEQHKNYSVAGTNASGVATGNAAHGGNDKGWHVGAAYTFPVGGGLKVGAVYYDLKYELGNLGAGSVDAKHKAYQIAADWKIAGPHGLRGGWTKANDTKINGGLPVGVTGLDTAGQTPCLAGTTCIAAVGGDNGADMWQITYYYTFSKRTEVGVGYVQLNNDSQGRYSLGGIPSPANGDKQDAFAVHVRHTF